MKKYLLITVLITACLSSQAQFLKKLKDKVNKTLDNKLGNTESVSQVEKKDTWCISDTLNAKYELAYSGGANKFTILYDESCLGTGIDGKGYSLVLTERVDGKTNYIVIENGKETGRYTEMKDQYLPCPPGNKNLENSTDYSKYVITDSTEFSNPGVAAQKITTQNIDEKKVVRGMELAKQTDEYKKMSAEEKKQFDEMMKNMPQMAGEYNKNAGNKTFEIPETKASSGYYISGQRVVVNKKEYGKFSMVQSLVVSPNEKNVFILGRDTKGNSVFIANDKTINLEAKGFTGTGMLVANATNSRTVYAEMKLKSETETEADMKDYENAKYTYRILKPDGSITENIVTGNFGTADFKLTNNGILVYVNSKTGQIFADGKQTGKFNLSNENSEELSGDKLLIGDSPDKICFYSSDGSLNYPDGTKNKLGIIFPRVTSENGKTTINWFRQCNNEIYICKLNF